MKRINRNKIDKWNRKIHGSLIVTSSTLRENMNKSIKILVRQIEASRLTV